MAKKEQAHQIDMGRKQQDLEKDELEFHKAATERHQRLFGRGQISATVIALAALGAGTLIAVVKDPKYGAAIIGATMTILSGVFVWANWTPRKQD